MRKIYEVLRLKYEHHLPERTIANSCGIARSTVQEMLKRHRQSELGWPLPSEIDEPALIERLYPAKGPAKRSGVVDTGADALSSTPALLPDFATLASELARKGVTLTLLWQEYKAAHPQGLQYSAFCERFAKFRQSQALVMRQQYHPGEKLFIDFAGPTLPITDSGSGEIRQASIFVAVLGYSNYTYACATTGQTTADWLNSQVSALEFFGGVPKLIVPDNPRALVSRACRYEPDLNPAYQDFARHYQTAIVPARVRRPRDKAKVEGAVLIVERWILAKLRHQTFFSLAELNETIKVLIAALNARAFKKLPGSRRSRFDGQEKGHLQPLPGTAYEYATWKKSRVHLDYHIDIAKHYYSTPFHLIGKSVDVRLTARMIEIFFRGKLVATHIKNSHSQREGGFSTEPGHRPPKHRAHIELNHERLRERALAVGSATATVIDRQWHAKQHPEQTLRRSLGILRLARDFDAVQLEAACAQALKLNALSYRAIRGLIDVARVQGASRSEHSDHGDHGTQSDAPTLHAITVHDNVRGAAYFATEINAMDTVEAIDVPRAQRGQDQGVLC